MNSLLAHRVSQQINIWRKKSPRSLVGFFIIASDLSNLMMILKLNFVLVTEVNYLLIRFVVTLKPILFITRNRILGSLDIV